MTSLRRREGNELKAVVVMVQSELSQQSYLDFLFRRDDQVIG
jgi:hypothetical protein